MKRILLSLLGLTWALSRARLVAADTVDTDLCIYGATSGGVIAAVQATKMGKSVALLSFNNHVGGMTSGGLGWVDFGKREAIGGLTRDYFRRIGKRYGETDAQYAVEPHVAEAEFKAMLAEAKVPVRFNQRLAEVTSANRRITQVRMEDGTLYRAKMFIDATYEGDLMAKAGVTWTIGRESIAQYNESLAGVRIEPWQPPVDPFVMPGHPASGLLPLIEGDQGRRNGQADGSVMAYNYRLCLTQNPANKLPITAPPGYQESTYELLGRLIDSRVAARVPLQLTTLIKMSRLPNGKADVNNQFSVSIDFIGQSNTYANASYQERAVIEQAHRNYIQGLLYYLGTSPRVPEAVRTEMQSWGLCIDEFQDTGGWPHQFYVREARRLVGDYVMQQQNVQGSRLAPDSVGLASYRVDSHSLHRFVRDGVLMTDGDLHDNYPQPYPLSYRSIIPRVGECENLFVTFALSASHVAFTSIRMEPVFMILSQSAATAAAIAIDGGMSVQTVPYEKLRERLLADGQLLEASGPTSQPLAGLLVDDAEGQKSGPWVTSGRSDFRVGTGSIHDGNAHKGEVSLTLTPRIPVAGEYELFVVYSPHTNRATQVPVSITIAGQPTKNITINQQSTQNGGRASLGKFQLPQGTLTSVMISNAGTVGYVSVDGLQVLPVVAPIAPVSLPPA